MKMESSKLLNQKNVDIDDLVKNTYIGREKLNEINELGHIIGPIHIRTLQI